MTSCMSYGLFGLSGTRSSSASSRRSTGSSVGRTRRLVEIVERQEAEQLADRLQALGLGVVHEVRRRPRSPPCTSAPPSSSKRHLLVRHRLHHVRAGDEHVAHAPHHEDEVGDRRAVDRAARAGAEDGGDLRDDAGGERVAQEDVGVAAERDHALLDAGAARVVEPDHRRAVPHRQVHDLADLLGVGLATASRRTR